jgi:hypothetical protein
MLTLQRLRLPQKLLQIPWMPPLLRVKRLLRMRQKVPLSTQEESAAA